MGPGAGACPRFAGVPCDARSAGPAAKLATLAARAALEQSRRVRSTKRASRAGRHCCASRLRTGTPAAGGPHRGRRLWRQRGGARVRRPRRRVEHHRRRFRGRRRRSGAVWAEAPGGRARPAGAMSAAPSSAASGSAREARFVLLTRGDCSSGAREASAASFAARPRGEQRREVGAQHRPPQPSRPRARPALRPLRPARARRPPRHSAYPRRRPPRRRGLTRAWKRRPACRRPAPASP